MSSNVEKISDQNVTDRAKTADETLPSKNLNVSQSPTIHKVAVSVGCDADNNKAAAKVISSPGVNGDNTVTVEQVSIDNGGDIAAEVISAPGVTIEGHRSLGEAPIQRVSVNTAKPNSPAIEDDNFTPIYDVNNVGVIDKFFNSILHVNQFNALFLM